MSERECVWCNESVKVRKDGRLAVHKWDVDWDQDRDRPIMDRCVGSETSVADAEEAMS